MVAANMMTKKKIKKIANKILTDYLINNYKEHSIEFNRDNIKYGLEVKFNLIKNCFEAVSELEQLTDLTEMELYNLFNSILEHRHYLTNENYWTWRYVKNLIGTARSYKFGKYDKMIRVTNDYLVEVLQDIVYYVIFKSTTRDSMQTLNDKYSLTLKAISHIHVNKPELDTVRENLMYKYNILEELCKRLDKALKKDLADESLLNITILRTYSDEIHAILKAVHTFIEYDEIDEYLEGILEINDTELSLLYSKNDIMKRLRLYQARTIRELLQEDIKRVF